MELVIIGIGVLIFLAHLFAALRDSVGEGSRRTLIKLSASTGAR